MQFDPFEILLLYSVVIILVSANDRCFSI